MALNSNYRYTAEDRTEIERIRRSLPAGTIDALAIAKKQFDFARLIASNTTTEVKKQKEPDQRSRSLLEAVLDDVMSKLDTSDLTDREINVIRLATKYTALRIEMDYYDGKLDEY